MKEERLDFISHLLNVSLKTLSAKYIDRITDILVTPKLKS